MILNSKSPYNIAFRVTVNILKCYATYANRYHPHNINVKHLIGMHVAARLEAHFT